MKNPKLKVTQIFLLLQQHTAVKLFYTYMCVFLFFIWFFSTYLLYMWVFCSAFSASCTLNMRCFAQFQTLLWCCISYNLYGLKASKVQDRHKQKKHILHILLPICNIFMLFLKILVIFFSVPIFLGVQVFQYVWICNPFQYKQKKVRLKVK